MRLVPPDGRAHRSRGTRAPERGEAEQHERDELPRGCDGFSGTIRSRSGTLRAHAARERGTTAETSASLSRTHGRNRFPIIMQSEMRTTAARNQVTRPSGHGAEVPERPAAAVVRVLRVLDVGDDRVELVRRERVREKRGITYGPMRTASAISSGWRPRAAAGARPSRTRLRRRPGGSPRSGR